MQKIYAFFVIFGKKVEVFDPQFLKKSNC